MVQLHIYLHSILLLYITSNLYSHAQGEIFDSNYSKYTTNIELAITCNNPPINEESYSQFKQSIESTINELIIENNSLSKIQSVSIPREYLINIKV